MPINLVMAFEKSITLNEILRKMQVSSLPIFET